MEGRASSDEEIIYQVRLADPGRGLDLWHGLSINSATVANVVQKTFGIYHADSLSIGRGRAAQRRRHHGRLGWWLDDPDAFFSLGSRACNDGGPRAGNVELLARAILRRAAGIAAPSGPALPADLCKHLRPLQRSQTAAVARPAVCKDLGNLRMRPRRACNFF